MSQVNNTINQGLIAIDCNIVNGESVETVNARKLYEFLEVNTRFNDWIASRIEQYNFKHNQDFVSFTENSVKPQGGRSAKNYYLSLNMARELSMVERTAKGKEARQYFIECEKKAKSLSMTPKELSRREILTMALEAEQKAEELLAINVEQHNVIESQKSVIMLQNDELATTKPKSAIFDMMAHAKNGFPFRASAHILNGCGALIDGKPLSIITFPKWLRDNRYLMAETKIKDKNGKQVEVKGEKWNLPFQKYQDLFITTPSSYTKRNGEIGVSHIVNLNIKGLIYFGKKLGVENDGVTEWLIQNGYIELNDNMLLAAMDGGDNA